VPFGTELFVCVSEIDSPGWSGGCAPPEIWKVWSLAPCMRKITVTMAVPSANAIGLLDLFVSVAMISGELPPHGCWDRLIE
jgi:hypothetical protein